MKQTKNKQANKRTGGNKRNTKGGCFWINYLGKVDEIGGQDQLGGRFGGFRRMVIFSAFDCFPGLYSIVLRSHPL